MLTSSDAKFRCLWYMAVWSVLLMFVSQFFHITNIIAFYIFASATMLLLPLVTSIYSTTSGQHGAGMLRVSYIFCDPVLACLSVIPVLLVNRLPVLVEDYICLQHPALGPRHSALELQGPVLDPAEVVFNTSCVNRSSLMSINGNLSIEQRLSSQRSLREDIGLIQGSLIVPSLLALSMGHRSRKMSYSTVVLVACYWLVVSIETAELIAIDVVSLATGYLHAIVSTAAIIAIASILSLSYAVVTLCSFISPTDHRATNTHRRIHTFDGLYRAIVGAAGAIFAEIPLLVIRSRIIAGRSQSRELPATFCIWMVKDVTFILVALVTLGVLVARLRRKLAVTACGHVSFDNPDVFFAPEKRDTYIAMRHGLAARPSGTQWHGDRHGHTDRHSDKHTDRQTDRERQLSGGSEKSELTEMDILVPVRSPSTSAAAADSSSATGSISGVGDGLHGTSSLNSSGQKPRKCVTFWLDVNAPPGQPSHHDDENDSSDDSPV